MDIGNQIRERRQALGLSQEELAQRLYVTRVTVSHWGTGKTLPDVQSMLLLANLFGTTIDEMVRGDVDEMREMVEKGEQQRKAFAIALGAVGSPSSPCSPLWLWQGETIWIRRCACC